MLSDCPLLDSSKTWSSALLQGGLVAIFGLPDDFEVQMESCDYY